MTIPWPGTFPGPHNSNTCSKYESGQFSCFYLDGVVLRPLGGHRVHSAGRFVRSRSFPRFALRSLTARGRRRLEDVGGRASRREVAGRRRHLETINVFLNAALLLLMIVFRVFSRHFRFFCFRPSRRCEFPLLLRLVQRWRFGGFLRLRRAVNLFEGGVEALQGTQDAFVVESRGIAESVFLGFVSSRVQRQRLLSRMMMLLWHMALLMWLLQMMRLLADVFPLEEERRAGPLRRNVQHRRRFVIRIPSKSGRRRKDFLVGLKKVGRLSVRRRTLKLDLKINQ